MTRSAQIKTRPSKQKKDLSYEHLIPKGNTTISLLISILKTYTHVDPIEPSYSVGSLVPDLDMLGADINEVWRLSKGKGFWSGEIETKWTVEYLAKYIDLKVKAVQ
jgi:hypothetical protein